MKPTNALSVDLEDWYHPEFVKHNVGPNPAPQIVQSTGRLLYLFERRGVKVTFFILGEIAARNPDLIRDIHRRGHEIACHGMSHRTLHELPCEEFDADLRQFRELMRKILGEAALIRGYRAPTFSIDNRTRHALPCLVDNGFVYDSSIFPLQNYLYGVEGAPWGLYRPDFTDVARPDPHGKLVEFPLTVCRFAGLKIPMTGFCLRFFPYAFTRHLLRAVNHRRPFVLYFHPWESYAAAPRVHGIGALNYFLTYCGIDTFLAKLDRLLADFEFTTMGNVIEHANL